MPKNILKVIGGRRGAAMIEYALLAALIGLALVAAITPLRTAITTAFGSIVTALTPS